ncbi:hypothetical protein Q604_UNBC09998G0001, partial [human gut metagenome]
MLNKVKQIFKKSKTPKILCGEKLKNQIEFEKIKLKKGEFSILVLNKEKINDLNFGDYLIAGTFPTCIENPPNIFSHYGENLKSVLFSKFADEQYEIVLIEKNKISKLLEFDDAWKLISKKSDKILS